MELLKYNSREIDVIKKLFVKTFTDSEGESEGKLIGNLVSDFMKKTDKENLHIYIAKENDKIIGCIIFSKMKFDKSSIEAYLMAPVAVHTDYQHRGVGKKLISWAHDDLKKRGVELVFTYGDINFYSKVGYRVIKEEIVKAPLSLTYPEGWMAQSLTKDDIEKISGNSYCVEAINKAEYW